MRLRTAIELVRTGQLPLLLRLDRLSRPMYRASFASKAASLGVLRLLAGGPASFDRIARHLGTEPEDGETLRTWLDLGVSLGELRAGPRGYALAGWWARKLAQPRYDIAAAALEEVVRFHHDALVTAPLVPGQERLSLADQDGELVARATRIVEPFVREAVDLVAGPGPRRWLEVGCGEGAHVRYACRRNPEIEVTAIDLQPEVAEVAAANVEAWGLAERVSVRAGDVRAMQLAGGFDVVTLHNLVYYFPVAERVALLERLRSLLAPGGKLLVTTACRGGSLGLEVINLWFATSDAGGAFPTPADLRAQLLAAGFAAVDVHDLKPGDAYHAFVATNQPAAAGASEAVSW